MSWRQRRARWQRRWLARRIPPARQITLGSRSLFILPTRLGLCYLLVMLAIYLLGTNYQNNLVLLVAYGLGSLFMVTMWLTHRNLLGLALLGGPAVLGEVGSPLPMRITVRSERPLQALQFSLNEGRLWLAQVDAVPQPLLLPVQGSRRGRLPLERLRVESRYPLGLFRCWSLLDLQLEGWLAPAPEYGPLRGEATSDAAGSRGQPTPASVGDFDTLRAHHGPLLVGVPLPAVAASLAALRLTDPEGFRAPRKGVRHALHRLGRGCSIAQSPRSSATQHRGDDPRIRTSVARRSPLKAPAPSLRTWRRAGWPPAPMGARATPPSWAAPAEGTRNASMVTAIARASGPEGLNDQVLTNPSGFSGVDGVFRFRMDGTNDRALAVMEIKGGAAQVASPAPRAFGNAQL